MVEIIKLIGTYRNGNYDVWLYRDGTRIMETVDANDKELVSEFPNSLDCKITNRCNMGCQMCYEASHDKGKHGDIMNYKFIDTLRPFTELAIGGGNPLEHPELEAFLRRLQDKKVVSNMTLNVNHFMENIGYVKSLSEKGLVYGIGVSLGDIDSRVSRDIIDSIRSIPDTIVHTIAGVTRPDTYKSLWHYGLSVLVLGYKDVGLGKSFGVNNSEMISSNKKWLAENLDAMLTGFSYCCFDNLALDQLKVKEFINDDAKWVEIYQGDDGSQSMFVDLVEGKYALNSMSDDVFDISDDVISMFSNLSCKRSAL